MSSAFDEYRATATKVAEDLGTSFDEYFNPALVVPSLIKRIGNDDPGAVARAAVVISHEIDDYLRERVHLKNLYKKSSIIKVTEVPNDDPKLEIILRQDPLTEIMVQDLSSFATINYHITKSLGAFLIDIAGNLLHNGLVDNITHFDFFSRLADELYKEEEA